MQTTPVHPSPFLRRVPRGNTGQTDLINQLRREAKGNSNRIRSMIRKASPQQRDELRALRRRLVDLLVQMTERPDETRVGSHNEILLTMAEARRIYARDSKPSGHRRAKRPPQEKRVRAKSRLSNVASEVTNDGKSDLAAEAARQRAIAHLRPDPSYRDPQAYSLEDEFGPQPTPPQEQG